MYDQYIRSEFVKQYQRERLSAEKTEQILEDLYRKIRKPHKFQGRFRLNLGAAFIAVGRWLNGRSEEGVPFNRLSTQPRAECVPCD